MYTLTLTKSERDAFDWVGDRYASGEVARILLDCIDQEASWSDDSDVTFEIPEHLAWEIRECSLEEDCFTCFAPELVQKMDEFLERIV